jgi:hypothetical protein
MSFSSTWLNSVDQQRAEPAGRPLAPAPDPEPGNPALADLAELAWLAARGTGWVLRRSTKLVFYPLAVAAREMRDRAHRDYQPLGTVSASSSARREDGTGVVVDLAAYRLRSQMARAPQLAHNAQPAGQSRQTKGIAPLGPAPVSRTRGPGR